MTLLIVSLVYYQLGEIDVCFSIGGELQSVKILPYRRLKLVVLLLFHNDLGGAHSNHFVLLLSLPLKDQLCLSLLIVHLRVSSEFAFIREGRLVVLSHSPIHKCFHCG